MFSVSSSSCAVCEWNECGVTNPQVQAKYPILWRIRGYPFAVRMVMKRHLCMKSGRLGEGVKPAIDLDLRGRGFGPVRYNVWKRDSNSNLFLLAFGNHLHYSIFNLYNLFGIYFFTPSIVLKASITSCFLFTTVSKFINRNTLAHFIPRNLIHDLQDRGNLVRGDLVP